VGTTLFLNVRKHLTSSTSFAITNKNCLRCCKHSCHASNHYNVRAPLLSNICIHFDEQLARLKLTITTGDHKRSETEGGGVGIGRRASMACKRHSKNGGGRSISSCSRHSPEGASFVDVLAHSDARSNDIQIAGACSTLHVDALRYFQFQKSLCFRLSFSH
jgi:hypothetical protein